MQDRVGNERRLHRENGATGGGNLAKLHSGLRAAASALELSWLVWKEGQPNPLTQNKYVQLTALHCKKYPRQPVTYLEFMFVAEGNVKIQLYELKIGINHLAALKCSDLLRSKNKNKFELN